MLRQTLAGVLLGALLVLLSLPKRLEIPDEFRPAPLVPSARNFPYLFKTLPRELENVKLNGTEGIPKWLNGAWVKTGFCVFGNDRYRPGMLFDASGCGYQINFNGQGGVTVSAKRLKSKYHAAFKEARYPHWRTFAEFEPPRQGMDKLLTLVSQDQADNYLVNLVSVGNKRIAALTDLAGEMELDPKTLDTKGIIQWNDELERNKWLMISSAHPSRIGSKPGKLYNYLLDMNMPMNMLRHGKPFVYNILEIDTVNASRRLVAQIPTERHHYVHENAVTPEYFVIIEFPFVWSFARIVTNIAIKNALDFVPELGIKFKVINISTGKLVRELHLPNDSFYAFHRINAHQEGENIILTMTAYDDIDYHLQRSFSLSGGHLNNTFDLPPASIRKVTLNLSSGTASSETLGVVDFELPVVSDAKRGSNLQFVYAHGKSVSHRQYGCKAGPGCGGTWWDMVVKVDIKTGEELERWRKDDHWPSEPIFIHNPNGTSEDDGVVLNLLLGDNARSYLLVLDAKTFQELANVALPTHLPYQSHGSWYSN